MNQRPVAIVVSLGAAQHLPAMIERELELAARLGDEDTMDSLLAIRQAVGEALRPPAPGVPLETAAELWRLLTPRECEVAELIAQGHSNKVVGRRLGISPRTVEVHRARAIEKLEVPGTIGLVRLVMARRAAIAAEAAR